MVIEIDGQRVRTKVLNSVKVILPDEGNYRHITITHEGIIADIIDDGGSVVESVSIMHEDLFELLNPAGDPPDDSPEDEG